MKRFLSPFRSKILMILPLLLALTFSNQSSLAADISFGLSLQPDNPVFIPGNETSLNVMLDNPDAKPITALQFSLNVGTDYKLTGLEAGAALQGLSYAVQPADVTRLPENGEISMALMTSNILSPEVLSGDIIKITFECIGNDPDNSTLDFIQDKVVITGTLTDGDYLKNGASLTTSGINDVKFIIPLQSIQITNTPPSDEIKVGDEWTFNTVVQPEDATYSDLTWTFSPANSVSTVSETDGSITVRGIAPGNIDMTVSAKTQDDSGDKTVAGQYSFNIAANVWNGQLLPANTTVYLGEPSECEVSMSEEETFAGLQFDVELPAGVVLKSLTPKGDLEDGFTVSFNSTGGNKYRVLAYNTQKEITTSGLVLNLNLEAQESLNNSFEGQIKIPDVVFSTLTGISIDGEGGEAKCEVIVNQPEKNIVKAGDVTLIAGKTGECLISLPNEMTFAGLQFDITLPDNVSVVSVTGTGALASGFNIRYNTDGNKTGIVAYNTSQEVTSSGNILVLTLKANEDVEQPESGAIAVSGVMFTTLKGREMPGTGQNGSYEINVPVSVIKITPTEETLLIGGSAKTFTATLLPEGYNLSDFSFSWDTSAVSQYVTVAGQSTQDPYTITLSGTNAGEGLITARLVYNDNSSEVTASANVIVYGNDGIVVKPGTGTTEGEENDSPAENTDKGGSLIGNDLTLRVGQTAAIKVELPENLTETPALVWSLGNGGEQFVNMTPDENSLGASFKGLAMGKTSYTISIEGQVVTGGDITVIAEHPMTSLRLNPEAIEMALNAPAVKIIPEYTPANASYTQLSWTSSNPKVATVADDGTVTPVGQGETVITASANDGSNLSAVSNVKVTEPVDDQFELDFSDAAMGGVDGLTIYIGDTYQLKPKAQEGYVLPENISWSSDNAAIVSVDNNGLILGKGLGTATVTASATVNGKTVSASCKVTVIAISASSITLSAENLKLFVGQSAILTATVYPADTTNPQIAWSTDNAEIATVSPEGKVVGVKPGTVNVTATCGSVSATCKVTVTGNENVVVKPGTGTSEGDETDSPADNTGNGGSLIGNDLTIRVGQTASIVIELPADLATSPTLQWSLAAGGEEFVAMTPDVNTLGAAFTGLKMGNTTYTVSLEGEDITGGNITVIAELPMISLILNPESIEMALNAPAVRIIPEYTPANASYTQLSWTSSNPKVATVTEDGTVTPVGQGETVITASANDGSNLSAVSNVKVTEPVDDQFELDFSDAAMGGVDGLTIYIGDTYQLKPKAQEGYVLPENISWSSDNAAIVSVDNNGLILGKGLGTATVTASATVNGKTVSASCKVTVIAISASSITLSAENLKLFVGQSAILTATVYPADTTNPQITWSTDNADIATVSPEGKVVGVKPGTVNITATCGSASATCKVTVTGNENVVVKPGTGTSEGDETDSPADNTDKGGSLIGNDLTIRVGQTASIVIELPADLATSPTLQWSLAAGGEEFVAMTPDANTLGAAFTGLKMGNTTYTVSLEGEDITGGNITVIAEHPMTSLRLNPESIEMALNAPAVRIIPEYTPANASYTQLSWTSSNPKVATVADDGTVTPVGQGETVITASANDGSNLSAVSNVKVTEPVDDQFELDFSDAAMGGVDGLTIYIGDTYQLKPKAQEGYVLPENISWSSDNTAIVSVDNNGLILGKGLGTATVTASATVNGKAVSVSCKVTVIEVPCSEILLNTKDATIFIGETVTIKATVKPDNVTDAVISWRSDNEDVASVSATGVVTGKKEGTANITASCGSVQAVSKITVKAVPAASVEMELRDVTLSVGESATLKAKVLPENTTYPEISWKTSDDRIASVNSDGIVKGIAPGTATITATCGDVSATCKVTVNPVSASSIVMEVEDVTLFVGGTTVLQAKVMPENVTDRTVTWSSADPDIATVDAEGKVTAVSVGTTTITASCGSVSADCKVTVNPLPSEGIVINPESITLTVGTTSLLEATVLPENTTDKSVTWISSDPAVATVSEDGRVTAIAPGTAVISAVNGENSAQCVVSVVPVTASSITLNIEDLTLTVGATSLLEATVYPAETTYPDLEWTSDNESVATVSPEGMVTAIAPGSATITVRCDGAEASCSVTVIPIEVSSITLNIEDQTIYVASTTTVTATISPENATDRTISWSSDRPGIASVDEYGTVLGVSAGTANITATCGNVSASCVITVIPRETPPINVTTSDLHVETISGEKVLMWVSAEGGNPDGWSFLWTSGDEILSTETNLEIVARNSNATPVTQTYTVEVENESDGAVIYSDAFVFSVEIWPEVSLPFDENADNPALEGNNDGTTQDEDGWYERNGIHISTLKTREGNDVGMWAEEPLGGYNNLWSYYWTILGNEIGVESHITYTAVMPQGESMETESQTPLVRFTNNTPSGEVFYETSAYGPTLDVYRRPQTPSQLLRKGDGTSHTFIVMMPISNDRLVQLKYMFVYGYTDSEGIDHILETTDLRYCHTTAEIFDDPSLTFWAYSLWAYPDGAHVSSGLRYLDGGADEGFDASDFSGDDTDLLNRGGETRTAIYTLDGHYRGTDTQRLVPGIYLKHSVENGVSKTKKIIVR